MHFEQPNISPDDLTLGNYYRPLNNYRPLNQDDKRFNGKCKVIIISYLNDS